VLRRTEKLATALPLSEHAPNASDTALGDWYVNRIVVQRQPLLLLVSAVTLLPIVMPAGDVRRIPERLPQVVRLRLQRLRVEYSWINAEVAAMSTVVVAKTASRSILGVMRDFAATVDFLRPDRDWDDMELRGLEDHLAEMPLFTSVSSRETIFPHTAAPERLRARWAAGEPGLLVTLRPGYCDQVDP
jgi:hypothetical protein